MLRSIAANRLLNNQLAKGDRVETGTDFSYNQNLAEDMMSSFIFNGNVDYKSNTSNVFSQYRLDYPNQATATTDYRNRYEHGQPNRTLSFSLSPQYEYWFNDIMFIRPAYKLTVEHQHHDYALYRLDQLAGYDAEASTGLGTLPSLSEYESTLDMQNSFWRKQRRVSNQLMLTWSISRWHGDDKDLWINVYLPLSHDSYRMDYRQADYNGVFRRHAWHFSPFIVVRKMWDQQEKYVELRYRLTHQTPDLVRFIDVRNDALYPFGFGLSYTTFNYSDFHLDSNELTRNGKVTASVTVTNTGKHDADEIVQLYIHNPAARIARPVKELKGFRRIHLKAGERQRVDFSLTPALLTYKDAEGNDILDPGKFDIMVGPNSSDKALSHASLNYIGE